MFFFVIRVKPEQSYHSFQIFSHSFCSSLYMCQLFATCGFNNWIVAINRDFLHKRASLYINRERFFFISFLFLFRCRRILEKSIIIPRKPIFVMMAWIMIDTPLPNFEFVWEIIENTLHLKKHSPIYITSYSYLLILFTFSWNENMTLQLNVFLHEHQALRFLSNRMKELKKETVCC